MSCPKLTALQPPLLEQTIGSFLAMRAIEMPDNIAVKDAFGRMTYAELNRESDAFAVALRKIGVSAKDRVVTTLGASIAHLIVIIQSIRSCGERADPRG